MQLDIFENSRDVMLRNDVIEALQRRDAAAARDASDRMGSNGIEWDRMVENIQRTIY